MASSGSGGPKPNPSWADIVAANTAPSSQSHAPSAPIPPAPPPIHQPVMGPTLATTSVSAVETCKKKIAARGFPNGFSTREEFRACMQDLCDTANAQGIVVKVVGVRGTAATFKSANPNKPGHHFDKKGPNSSDIDIFFVTDSFLANPARPNKHGFVHPDKIAEAYPDIEGWNQEWTTKLGRDATAAAFRSASPALTEPHVPYTCGSKTT